MIECLDCEKIFNDYAQLHDNDTCSHENINEFEQCIICDMPIEDHSSFIYTDNDGKFYPCPPDYAMYEDRLF